MKCLFYRPVASTLLRRASWVLLTAHLLLAIAAEPFHFTDMADRLPAVPFREYSFLANERTPQALKVGGRQ